VPLAASVTHQLVELLGKQYVDNLREQARSRQQALLTHYISAPLAEWLAEWPATGGSAYERLQMALRRVPAALGPCWSETCSREAALRIGAVMGWNDEAVGANLEALEMERSAFLGRPRAATRMATAAD